MRGLDQYELRVVDMIASGFQPVDEDSPTISGLVRRGVLARGAIVRCPALLCPGHAQLEVTALGSWLWNVVRNME